MTTAVMKKNAYGLKNMKKESVFTKIWNAYQENLPEVICGYLALNGSCNVYPVYRALKEK